MLLDCVLLLYVQIFIEPPQRPSHRKQRATRHTQDSRGDKQPDRRTLRSWLPPTEPQERLCDTSGHEEKLTRRNHELNHPEAVRSSNGELTWLRCDEDVNDNHRNTQWLRRLKRAQTNEPSADGPKSSKVNEVRAPNPEGLLHTTHLRPLSPWCHGAQSGLFEMTNIYTSSWEHEQGPAQILFSKCRNQRVCGENLHRCTGGWSATVKRFMTANSAKQQKNWLVI